MLTTQNLTLDGLSIRCADSRTPGRHALLLNPWPESLYAFEPIWPALAREAHLLDHRTNVDELEMTDGRQIVTGTLGRIDPSYPTPEHIRADYLDAYAGRRFADSMRFVRAYPADLPVLRDLVPKIQTPVRIISGARDTAVPPSNGQFLHDRLPNSKGDVVDSGHFVAHQGLSLGRGAVRPRIVKA